MCLAYSSAAEQRAEHSAMARTTLLGLCRMRRRRQYPPLQWATSWTGVVCKHNGKVGCKGWRCLEILAPMGLAWVAQLWAHRPRAYSSSQFGYVQGRQRMRAVLATGLERWRIAAAGYLAATILYDTANGFPSTAWTSLDEAAEVRNDVEDGCLLQGRYRRMASVLAHPDGEDVVLRPCCGDRQGDAPAAQRFVLAQDPTLDCWTTETATPLEHECMGIWDDWSEQWRFPLRQQYADDAARTVAAATPEELIERVQW